MSTSGLDSPNVCLIVLDSLRLDTVGAVAGSGNSKTPNIDEFARDAQVVTSAFSTSSWTVPTHASLFTGKLPSEHGVFAGQPILDSDRKQTLAAVLSSHGYTTDAVSANPWLINDFGFTDGFNSFDSVFPELPYAGAGNPRMFARKQFVSGSTMSNAVKLARWALEGSTLRRIVNTAYTATTNSPPYTPAEKLNSHVFANLDSFPQDAPSFLFINYMDAHEPYSTKYALPSHGRSNANEVDAVDWNLASLDNTLDDSTTEAIRAQYDASVRYLDHHLGHLFRELQDREQYDNSLIVVVSDHGQSLGEQQYWGHGTMLHDSLIRVPLLIKFPSGATETPSREIWSIRHVPSIITDIVGIPVQFNSRADQFNDNLVVAESHGPHETTRPNTAAWLEEYQGTRVFRDASGNTATYDITAGEFDFENGTADKFRECVHDLNDHLELCRTNEQQATVSATNKSVEQRLEDLGYL